MPVSQTFESLYELDLPAAVAAAAKFARSGAAQKARAAAAAAAAAGAGNGEAAPAIGLKVSSTPYCQLVERLYCCCCNRGHHVLTPGCFGGERISRVHAQRWYSFVFGSGLQVSSTDCRFDHPRPPPVCETGPATVSSRVRLSVGVLVAPCVLQLAEDAPK